MATGSEIVAAKLFWAAGYHTAEYHIAQLVPSNLVIGKDTRITPPGEMPRPMNQSDIMWLLGRADRDPDGSYRVILSKAAPGRPVGRIKFQRHPRRRSKRRHPARTPARAARLLRVRRVAQSRRREGHQLAVDARHGERAQVHPQLPARFRIGARQRRDRPAGRLGRLRGARRRAGEIAQARLVARRRRPGVAHAGLFRVAGDRPTAARSFEVASRTTGGRTSPTRRSATCGRTTHSGRRQNSPRSTTR